MKDLLPIAILVLAIGLTLLLLIYNGFRIWKMPRRIFRAAWILWIVFCLVGGGGFLSGISWHETDRIQLIGFPVPVAVFVWEETRWTDFISPVGFWLNSLAALLAGQLLLTALLLVRGISNRGASARVKT
ncbi:MAG TPA: hypothetical protein DCX07_11745 [Phycisphaerales bacterium]|nr:hypothetical protein [Phycisphaerales bacterium]